MAMNNMRLVPNFLCLAVVGICLLFASRLQAHPFHLCVGQMKWNVDSKIWEVSLRLHPQDLETALTAERNKLSTGRNTEKASQRVSVDDADFSDLATKYLDSHFFVRATPLAMNDEEFNAILRSQIKSGTENGSTLKWIGMEQERGWLWIHFELTQPSVQPEHQKLWLVHRILLDSVERQENTIAIDPTITEKYSLQFRSGREFQELKSKKNELTLKSSIPLGLGSP